MKMKILVMAVFISSIGFLVGCFSEDPSSIVTYEEQLEFDKSIIRAYLDQNSITAIEDESGIFYVENITGTGPSPVHLDSIVTNYTMDLLSGRRIDEVDGGRFRLDFEILRAWQISLPWMKEGGSMTIYAPSGYCYGNTVIGDIPPNSILVFDISLEEVLKNEDP